MNTNSTQFRAFFGAAMVLLLWLAVPAQTGEMYNGWPLPSATGLQVDSEPTFTDFQPFLVLFPGHSEQSGRTALESAGCEVIGYLSGDWWLVYSKPETDFRTTSALARINGIFPLNPEWKAAPALRTLLPEAAGETIRLIIYARSLSLGLRESIAEAGGSVTSVPLTPGKARLGVGVPFERLQSFLDHLSDRPEVYLIQPGAGAEALNDHASRILQNGQSLIESRPLWDRGLYGQGQVIAVLDTGLDYDSCYFAEADGSAPPLVFGVTGEGTPDLSRRKVLIYNLLYHDDFGASPTDFDNQGHGTLVAGNALGSSLADPRGRDARNGIAPEARLVVQDAGFTTYDDCSDLAALGCPVVDLSPFLEQAYAQGARIHNNSWGDRENYTPGNTYTGPTADMDEAVWHYPDLTIVCAAGNAGAWDTVASPSVGKNVLSVGACGSPSYSGNENTLAGFSSRGWASDGRIKPDLIAPGMTSTSSSDRHILTQNCTLSLVQGTSMASPVTAGCVALVRQYFAEGWYPTGRANPVNALNASAALVKAVLIAGAQNMTGVTGYPPSREEGWGRIQLNHSLYFSGTARRLIVVDRWSEFSVSGAEPYTLTISTGGATGAGPLKIVLVWTDYPGNPAAAIALVNDLDLEVRNLSTGLVYYGNNLSGGFSTTGTVLDRLNNVEVVALPESTSGFFEVEVRPFQIVEPVQGFALVIAGDVLETTSLTDNWSDYR